MMLIMRGMRCMGFRRLKGKLLFSGRMAFSQLLLGLIKEEGDWRVSRWGCFVTVLETGRMGSISQPSRRKNSMKPYLSFPLVPGHRSERMEHC